MLRSDLIDSDLELMNIACDIGSHWEEIGTRLGLSYTLLQTTAASNPTQEPHMMAYHMLQRWKRQLADGCSYQELRRALEDAGMNLLARRHCYQACVAEEDREE